LQRKELVLERKVKVKSGLGVLREREKNLEFSLRLVIENKKSLLYLR